ncbi:uncharacterized protein TNCV_1745941 [Trichonephila clavipes]|nr:uncharacterized protein TNCV_1745941 [Trichonephila clavipes]
MDLISSIYRKPEGRPTKRRKMLAENSKNRWQKSSKTVDEKNSNSMKVPCKYSTNCTLVIKQHHSMGYSTKLELLCESCHESYGSVFKFQEEANNSHDINSKLEIIDVSVSYDGIWQKRGHTSNLGLGIIIDVLSGLVLDFEVLSKYCKNFVVAGRDMGVDIAEFHIWQKGHADECDKNFDGTSGAMEMHAALIMWRRSISDCQMRFISMLSDGD